MNNRIPKRQIQESESEEEESSEEERPIQQRKKRLENQPTQNITSPTPSTDPKNKKNNNNNNNSGNKNLDYVNGSIVRIKLNNFVTYSDVEFKPGPRLNVIIGPNGSGKSSIVCAIALGLGGGPQLLGRQKQLGDFIKHGCNTAYIEIELFNEDGENYVIRRDLKKDGGASDFKLNGRAIAKIDLLATIKKLNVQIDNLCQFLPQDKVVSFASMSPTELLLETEKAININNMYENHQELIKLQGHQEKDSTNFEELKKNLDEMTKKNQALEKDVDKFKERQRLLEQVELYRQKKAWAIFENARLQTLETKKQKEQAETEIKSAEIILQPLKQSIAAQTKSIEKSRNDVNTGNTRVQQFESEISKSMTNDTSLSTNIEAHIKSIEELQDKEKKRKDKERSLTTQHNAQVQTLQNLPPDTDSKLQIEEANRKLRDLNARQGDIGLEIKQKQVSFDRAQQDLNQVTREIHQLSNASAQKLEYLKRDNNEVFQAYQWLHQNRNLFEKAVFGPICVEMNVQNPEHAAYLEMTINKGVLMTFVFQTTNDRNTFHKNVIESGKRLHINTLMIDKEVRWDRVNNIDDFRSSGATMYLDQTFECDPVVKSAIIDTIPIHKSIVFDRTVIGKEEQIANQINSFFTPNGSFYTTYSRYGDRKPSTRVYNFKNASILSGVNINKKQELEVQANEMKAQCDQVKQEVDQLRQRERAIINERNAVNEERQKFNSQIEERRKIVNKISHLLRQIEDAKMESDIETEEKRIRDKIKIICDKRVELLAKITQLLTEYFKVMGARDHSSITVSRFEAKLRAEEEAYRRESEKLESLRARVSELARAYEQLVKETKRKRQEAEKICPHSEEMIERFKELRGKTFDEIEDEINSAETKAKFIISNNPKVLEEYQERKQEIEKIEEKLSRRREELTQNTNRMKKLKEDWLIPVREFIQQVNNSFSLYFAAIKCLGEVHLGWDQDHPDDFSKYFVDIRVKFRNEDQLKTLNAQMQSGGERSVSTMLYLISLQDLTTCPFRVVDEINQGMDPKNERMIFDQIVKSVSSEGSPQYFLITPKLLHNLHYSPETTVLCVFTGPWFLTQKQWDDNLRRIIENRKNGNHGNKQRITNGNNNRARIEESDEEDEDSDE